MDAMKLLKDDHDLVELDRLLLQGDLPFDDTTDVYEIVDDAPELPDLPLEHLARQGNGRRIVTRQGHDSDGVTNRTERIA